MTDDQLRLLRVMADPCSYPPGHTREREAIDAALTEIDRLHEESTRLRAAVIQSHYALRLSVDAAIARSDWGLDVLGAVADAMKRNRELIPGLTITPRIVGINREARP